MKTASNFYMKMRRFWAEVNARLGRQSSASRHAWALAVVLGRGEGCHSWYYCAQRPNLLAEPLAYTLRHAADDHRPEDRLNQPSSPWPSVTSTSTRRKVSIKVNQHEYFHNSRREDRKRWPTRASATAAAAQPSKVGDRVVFNCTGETAKPSRFHWVLVRRDVVRSTKEDAAP